MLQEKWQRLYRERETSEDTSRCPAANRSSLLRRHMKPKCWGLALRLRPAPPSLLGAHFTAADTAGQAAPEEGKLGASSAKAGNTGRQGLLFGHFFAPAKMVSQKTRPVIPIWLIVLMKRRKGNSAKPSNPKHWAAGGRSRAIPTCQAQRNNICSCGQLVEPCKHERDLRL